MSDSAAVTQDEPDRANTDAARLVRRLAPKSLGFSIGLLAAVFVLIGTLVASFAAEPGGFTVFQRLEAVLWGYSLTIKGALIGSLYGFALGSLGGTALAHLYNFFSSFRRQSPDA
ncbi:MAG: hypothetical protein AAF493_09040 [Pseudomonadota bacterium]